MSGYEPEGKSRDANGAVELESLFHEEPDEAARRIIRENAPFAAQAIVNLATDDTVSPSTRLNASKYVIDRILGPVGAQGDEEGLLEQFLQEIEAGANGKSTKAPKKQ